MLQCCRCGIRCTGLDSPGYTVFFFFKWDMYTWVDSVADTQFAMSSQPLQELDSLSHSKQTPNRPVSGHRPSPFLCFWLGGKHSGILVFVWLGGGVWLMRRLQHLSHALGTARVLPRANPHAPKPNNVQPTQKTPNKPQPPKDHYQKGLNATKTNPAEPSVARSSSSALLTPFLGQGSLTKIKVPLF